MAFSGTICFALTDLHHPSMSWAHPLVTFSVSEFILELFSDYSRRFDELVLFRVAPRFPWDSWKEGGAGERAFCCVGGMRKIMLSCLRRSSDTRSNQQRRSRLSCFVFLSAFPLRVFYLWTRILLSFVWKTPPVLNPIVVGLRQDK